MISIEKQLLKRFVLIAIGLVLTLGLLHHWWAERFYLKIQKQQLIHESHALFEHLHGSDNILTNLSLKLPQHSSHLYLIKTQTEQWSSSPERFKNLPVQRWLSQDGFQQYEDSLGASYLILSTLFTKDIQIAVIQDTTASLAELDKSHAYMVIVVTLALAMLLLLQGKIIRQTFSRFDSTKAQIYALQRGERPALSDTDVEEISPLIKAINQLLTNLSQRTERSNNAVGNLSHAMKTPIAVIKQIAEKQNSGLQSGDRQQLIEQADQLNYIISSELKRARISGRGQQPEQFSIRQAIYNLTETLPLIYAEKVLLFTPYIDQTAHFPGNQADFNELLGNLLDNASKWCQQHVEIRIKKQPGKLQILVEDDGPGCSDGQLKTLTKRGVRLDEQAQGHGLGLNIVMTIVEQYDGDISLSRAPRGGLAVNIVLPTNNL